MPSQLKSPRTSCSGLLHPSKPPAPEKFNIVSGDARGLGLPYLNPPNSLKPWFGNIPDTHKISAIQMQAQGKRFVTVYFVVLKG